MGESFKKCFGEVDQVALVATNDSLIAIRSNLKLQGHEKS